MLFPLTDIRKRGCWKIGRERFYLEPASQKNILFFYVVKNFPQEIENTREIIENMSEIF